MKSSRKLVKTVSSVSAASLLAFGPRPASADIPKAQPTIEPPSRDPKTRSAEPILLTPASIEGQLYADHTSHASHASHYSGAGGDGGDASSVSPSDTPSPYTPIPPPAQTPTTPYTPYPPGTPTPTPSPPQNIIQIEFTNGATLIGTVLAKNADGIIFGALTGKNYKIPWTLLSQKTIDSIKQLIP